MKKAFFILIVISLMVWSCDKEHIEKPKNVVKKKQMIEMLIDIHMAEATYVQMRYDSTLTNSTSTTFYHSVLDKFNVQDSLFEQSFIYYASKPKEFEKMYREVMNKLSEIEQEYSGRKNEILEFENLDE